MEVLFLVHGDGSVEEVRLVESSGDPAWDHSAADSMKQWKFAFATPDSTLEAQWVRTTLIVQVQEPIVMTLGELTAGTRREADSLYALLLQGADFTTLAKTVRQDAPNQCGWFLGATNISKYPPHIREALRSLALNGLTPPLQIDSRYAIFKRLEPGAR
jgi:TonB family protein